jgi:YHS domain-containing protein
MLETGDIMDQQANVAFDGECAFALSTGKTGVEGKAAKSSVVNGTIYYFSNPVAKMLFKVLPDRTEKAQATWDSRPATS